MEKFLLVHLPSPVLGTSFVLLTVGLAVGGLALVRRSVALNTLESHNDVAGFIIAVVGVLYAVLLAFVVVIVWEQYDVAAADANSEAVVVGQLYRDTDGLGSGATGLRQDVHHYADTVVNDEWETMANGKGESPLTDAALRAVWSTFRTVQPTTPAETAFHSEYLRRLNDLEAARQDRLLEADSALPGPLWITLLVGGAITIGFTYFFGVSNFRAQLLMVAALSTTIGLILFLIISLDYPFTGTVRVDSRAMQDTIAEFSHSG